MTKQRDKEKLILSGFQTFSAPLLAEEEAAAGSGAGGAEALSKSSKAPERDT